MIIKNIKIRRIIDSRGNPTVEADVTTEGGFGRAAAPAGASTGTHEVMAWPEGSVSKGMKFAEEKTIPKIIGLSADRQEEFDQRLKDIDNTANFSNLGGNVAVALSLATAKAASNTKGIPLFKYLSKDNDYSLPAPMANVLGGGAHAVGGTDIQEYLVTAFHDDFSTAIEANSLVHKTVKSLLKEKFPNIALGKGDEGAWVAPLENVEALELVAKAANKVEQEDFKSWASLTEQTDALIIGDDLYVTNSERLQKGIEMKSTNSILIKPNQIGTLTDTQKAVDLAHKADMATVISHRSGETTDSTIAHLGVAFGSHAIKTGIMGGERIAKLNELVRISEQLR